MPTAPSLIRWPSIELLHQLRRLVLERHSLNPEAFTLDPVSYRSKVKLHGTCASIVLCPDGTIYAQGKKRLLSKDKDNAGFAAWVDQNKAMLRQLGQPNETSVIFGEWCGPDVQTGVAVSRVTRRLFFPFAIMRFVENVLDATVDIEPSRISAFLPEHPDIYVLPWHSEPLELDFSDMKKLEASAESINAMVESIELRDPFVYEVFGIEGPGEGVVMYPLLDPSDQPADFVRCTSLLFKAKGAQHRVRKQKKAAMAAPKLPQSVEAFVEMYATSARFAQAASEVEASVPGGKFRSERMGTFLDWLRKDVQKEGGVDLQSAGLKFKDVQAEITNKAKAWYLSRT